MQERAPPPGKGLPVGRMRLRVATLRGTATVTGIGAGQGASFIASVQAGGPGTTVKLDVSGFTFHEILVEGHIDFD